MADAGDSDSTDETSEHFHHGELLLESAPPHEGAVEMEGAEGSHERGTPTSTALEEEATRMSICGYCERLVAHSVLRATFPRWCPGVRTLSGWDTCPECCLPCAGCRTPGMYRCCMQERAFGVTWGYVVGWCGGCEAQPDAPGDLCEPIMTGRVGGL
jgi:hypothetical protein